MTALLTLPTIRDIDEISANILSPYISKKIYC